jgi:hypothetical protein
VALPAAEELIRLTRSADVLPGFRHGVTAVARDIARHVSFAELFLAEASEQEPHLAAAIEEQMQRFTPVARSALGLD